MSPFLAWGNFHACSRFARSTIPEEKWGTTRSLLSQIFPSPFKGSNYFYELKGDLRPVMHKYFMTVLKISKYLQGLVLKTMQA